MTIVRRRWAWQSRRSAIVAGIALLTVAVTWLYAHEGHAPLPTRGAQVDPVRGVITLSAESRQALDVRTVEVEDRSLPEFVAAYATLVSPWQRHAFASSRLPGQIIKMNVQAGELVAANTVLAEVKSLELENLQLELLNALNDIRLSERILKGYRDSAASVVGQTILDAEFKLLQQRQALDVARSKWISLGLSAEDLEGVLDEKNPRLIHSIAVRSPVSGTVIHADLSVGRVIEPGEHLFEVVDLSTVWANIGVLEADLRRVEVGQRVDLQLTAYPGETFQSSVRIKGLRLDPQTHLNSLWAEFENPSGKEPRLLPGMSGQAKLHLPRAEGFRIIPMESLINDGVERYVLVEQANTDKSSEYLRTPVIVRRQTGEWAEVKSSGFFPGTRVVTRGAHELSSLLLPGVVRLSPEAMVNFSIKVEPLRHHVIDQVATVEGAVEIPPNRRAYASAHLPGNLARIRAEVGQTVQAGQIVAEVVGLEFQNLQTDLLKEHLALQLTDQQLRDLKTAPGSVSTRRLLDLESERNATRNRRDSLRRRLEVVGLTSDQIDAVLARKQLLPAVPVRSPVAGVLVHFEKVLGQAIKAEEPLFEVHDLTRPLVRGYVSERDLVRVHLGQQARVRFVSDPGAVHTGKVVRSGRIFANDQTLSIWLEMDQEPAHAIRHSQLAQITLTVSSMGETLALPKAAVVREGTQAFVFLQQPDGTFDRRPVETGRSDDRLIEIRRGLVKGDLVAVSGAAELWTAYSSVR